MYDIMNGILYILMLITIFIVWIQVFLWAFYPLKLYGMYTNGLVTFRMIQYDWWYVTLEDAATMRLILINRLSFIHHFRYLPPPVVKDNVVDINDFRNVVHPTEEFNDG